MEGEPRKSNQKQLLVSLGPIAAASGRLAVRGGCWQYSTGSLA
jgi:hypothetical protein